ncbi:biliverdin-producing heme oxygenase [Alienimonas californiensis]|uniref:Heme oxygenase n=1 Tax=Alienimonas californiensis TaxID=2527989 RepID=A0A517PBE5_9PLAN|nr:biliverdin-producing heme oxygenase [Alienimonas californiensis]QDT16705.1 Heme oxygenase [Alienimonas californiensis]
MTPKEPASSTAPSDGALPDGVPSDGTAALLRAATDERHRAVEARLDLGELLRSRAGYAALLGYFAASLAPVEAWIDAHPHAAALPDGRRRGLPLLREDLRALGVAAEPAGPVAAFNLAGPSEAHLLGVLYVVEGSALGGLTIAKQARRALGVTAETGASFFLRNAGDPLGPWTRFKQRLDARVRSSEQRAAAVDAARAAFDQFLRQPAPAAGPPVTTSPPPHASRP